MKRKHARLSVAMIGLLVVTACGPAQAPGGPAAGPDTGASPQAPKTLVVVVQRELQTWDAQITGEIGAGSAGGESQVQATLHDGLTRTMATGLNELFLAAERPDDTKGTWVVNPDGTMDMTWKIRQDARWHDGTPVTSADWVFAFTVRRDREAARGTLTIAQRLITSVSAPDPYTFVTHWRAASIEGIEGEDPLPKHILEPVYLQDKSAIPTHRYFTTEFVGTGPFKLARWEPGSHMELERFDDYYKGPARIGRLLWRFVPDPNTMAANILAEAVDVVLPQGIGVDVAVEIRDRWRREGTGHQVLLETREGVESLEIMHDPVYARPVNGMTQAGVRQALLQAINRPELKEAMVGDLSDVALTFYHPTDKNYQFVKDVVPRYAFPYDVRRAQELLTGAGWAKGPDGILVHQPSGERFDYNVQIRAGSGPLKQASIIQDYWKVVGVALDIEVLTQATQNDNQYIGTKPGASMITASGGNYYGRRLHSQAIPIESNRWTGNNRGRFNNPVVDDILDRLPITINEGERGALHRQLLDLTMGAVFYHPFYWDVRPTLMLKGVTGPRLLNQTSTMNIWEWDKN
ncbi:MAG: hypothetical protein HY534_06590 [Chloroflexi bacterium]|nr:hypothetical protein [Chloroflexota bacterium]